VNDYFDHVIRQLSIEEVALLGILSDKDATATFKSMKRSHLFETSEMSLANFRKTMEKLKATSLIEVVTGGKEHKVFLTLYGHQALEKSLEGVNYE
jgi:predicted transcriptional regulator